jgi:hypothetical protein
MVRDARSAGAGHGRAEEACPMTEPAEADATDAAIDAEHC